MPGALSLPNVHPQQYTELAAPSHPVSVEMSATGGRLGGPELGESEEPERQRPAASRLVVYGIGIYMLYRLLT